MERCRPIIKAKNRRFNRRYLGIGRLAATRGLGELLKSYIAGEDRPGALKLSPSRFSRCEPILFRCYVPLPSIMRWFILDNLSLRWEKEGGFLRFFVFLRKTKKKERKRTKKNCFSNIYIYPRSVLFEKSRNKRYSYSIFDIFREFTNVKKKRESSSIHFFHFSSQTFSPISFYVYSSILVFTAISFSMEKNLSSRYSYSCSVFK